MPADKNETFSMCVLGFGIVINQAVMILFMGILKEYWYCWCTVGYYTSYFTADLYGNSVSPAFWSFMAYDPLSASSALFIYI